MSKKVFCIDCEYIDIRPTDTHNNYYCKAVKETSWKSNPIRPEYTITRPNPFIDNLHNECPYYSERQKFINRLFNWSW